MFHISTSSIPEGTCQCGCGESTPLARTTSAKMGRIKGQPVRFLPGHYRIKSPIPYKIQDTGYETPCWLWQRCCNRSGYGKIRGDGRSRGAHQFYYEKARGPVPPGLNLDHLCRQRACVNPDHLEIVTSAVNTQRGVRTKLTPEQVMGIRHQSGRSASELAGVFGVSTGTVEDIRRGKSWKNLPIIPPAQAPRMPTSSFIGVSWKSQYGTWTATISYRNRQVFIGNFRDEEAAARARDARALELHGDRARLNFPEACAIGPWLRGKPGR